MRECGEGGEPGEVTPPCKRMLVRRARGARWTSTHALLRTPQSVRARAGPERDMRGSLPDAHGEACLMGRERGKGRKASRVRGRERIKGE